MTGNAREPTLLDRIAHARSEMGRGERRVADYVLDHPEPVTRATLAELAAGAGVSEPTVLRFVRGFGCAGFPEFRVRVGQSLVTGVPYVHREIAFADDVATIADKIFSSSIHALELTAKAIDREALTRAVDAMRAARRVDCFGNGAASVLAFDTQAKLLRLGVPAIAYTDGHLQTMAAATLGAGDVALAFSHTGAVRDIVRTAKTARAGGATVVALTAPGSPLAKSADILLAVPLLENTEIYAPMTARLGALAMIDALVTALTVSMGEAVVERLRRVKDSVAEVRMPGTRS
jgi:RpiR family carbohydrate utilization transcriptional regulator